MRPILVAVEVLVSLCVVTLAFAWLPVGQAAMVGAFWVMSAVGFTVVRNWRGR